ncbi:hypothetical protein ACIQUQ_29725 [Streptomyces sp. NPDC101118]|uniref:hypothetical protein n=1 Tax=Streptomyces sp. NPDC101118 TaxID=3366109 RepID=UPI003819CA66
MSATLISSIARTAEPQSMLRRFLALDAVVTGANGLVYAAFSGPVGRLLGVGEGLVLELGILLALYGAAVGWLASRREPPAVAVKAVVEINLAWAALSVVALLVWFDPTTAGAVWIPAQALTVAGFAVLQQLALRSRTQ